MAVGYHIAIVSINDDARAQAAHASLARLALWPAEEFFKKRIGRERTLSLCDPALSIDIDDRWQNPLEHRRKTG